MKKTFPKLELPYSVKEAVKEVINSFKTGNPEQFNVSKERAAFIIEAIKFVFGEALMESWLRTGSPDFKSGDHVNELVDKVSKLVDEFDGHNIKSPFLKHYQLRADLGYSITDCLN